MFIKAPLLGIDRALWVGQSLLNVWIYAGDAVKMQLVLTSGLTGDEGGFHDWNYLLDTLGLLNSTDKVAGIIRFFGTIVILAALAGSIYYSWPRASDESNSHNRGFEWDR